MGVRLVEITFYPMLFPKITAYYMLDHAEYSELKHLFDGLYIENFLGDETLSNENCEYHVYEKAENIKQLQEFLITFGTPCDLLSRIKSMVASFQVHGEDTKEQWCNAPKDGAEDSSEDLIASITEILDEARKNPSDDGHKINDIIRRNRRVLEDPDVKQLITQRK